jgi:tRNA A37 threonylcarbamoyladenosine dehydratase
MKLYPLGDTWRVSSVANGRAERFGGVARLYGAAALERLQASRVTVIGLGGVGSWTVEALARSGVGALTLVDLDDVCITNTNRQLHAVAGAIGRPKAEVLAERVASIDPGCSVAVRCTFLTRQNVDDLLADGPRVVVDCIDSGQLKALLIARCRDRGIGVVTVGGAGGRRDPTAVRATDLGLVSGDGLLRKVRRELRTHHGFPGARSRKASPLGVTAITSTEQPTFPWSDGSCHAAPEPGSPLALDCASGFGTAAFATGAFGLAAAAQALELALAPNSRS